MKIDSTVLFLNGSRGTIVLDQLLLEGRNIAAIVAPENSIFWREENKYKDFRFIKNKHVNHPDVINELKSLNADLFIVAGFPTIFKKEILNLPKFGVINLHGGRLPHYRGGSPLNWQIINDENSIGISIISMDEGIDTGDVIEEVSFQLEDNDDINSVHLKANVHFAKLVSKVLYQFENNQSNPRIQDSNLAQYWTQRCEKDSFIDWNNVTARQAFNLIRALKTPYPSAYTFANNEKIYLYEAIIPDLKIRGTPGKVFYLDGKGPYIICKDQSILITKLSEKLKNGIYLND